MADGSISHCERVDLTQIAAALGLSKRAVEQRARKSEWRYVEQPGLGGRKRLYALRDLPGDVQAAIALHAARTERAAQPAPREARRVEADVVQAAWARYERTPDTLKAVAQQRLRALHAVESLHRSGMPLMQARKTVAAQMQRDGIRGGSVQSLCRWAADVAGVDRAYWLAMLLPAYTGRTATADIEPEAWAIFKADFLRLEAPSAASCYRRLQRIAASHADWAPLPALRTFIRRIEREIAPQVRVLARKGDDALMRMYPAQERDRAVFTALQGVNADGHVWDVGVTFPDGSTGRPVIVAFQDLYSGKILGWRLAPTESADLVRLAFADTVSTYGIPGAVWLDNGRAFASKYLTGGTPNRYRFRVREEDPAGIITALGVEVHWVTPYHGQAKPIERAWRDFCADIARHPAFAGAYLGNSVANKPANYGSRTVPWDEFVRVVTDEIAQHNAREGRRSKVCAGRSFDLVFAESYASSTIRRATSEQLRTLLLAAEAVTASATDGSVRLAGNRYWTDALARHAGQKLVLRFDPMALHTSVHAYQLDGTYIGEADCVASVGFADTNASREHARAKKQWKRAAKQQLDAERRMDAASIAAQLPATVPDTLPEPGVIAPVFGRRPPARPEREPLAATGTDGLYPDVEHANKVANTLIEAEWKRRIDAMGWAPTETDR